MSHLKCHPLRFAVLLFTLLILSCKQQPKTNTVDVLGHIPRPSVAETKPIYTPQSPEETIKSISVPEGFELQLVASEPMISEPVAISWDPNGRLFVAEMRTYMQDVNGTGTNEPVSRISMLEDLDGDGKMDKSTVFIDSLLLPRIILALDDRLLVGETYTTNIWSYSDSNGDGKADEKKLVYNNPKRDTRNLEHQRSGLVWNLDNWIYMARSPVRFKFKDNKMVADTLMDAPFNQWGIGKDDYGRLFFSIAGREVPANGFQLNPKYGNLDLEGQLEKGFEATWPGVTTPDVQGGQKRLRENITLNHFTAPCGQTVYRGDALPESMKGDLFVCEPVGRLIRRAKVTDKDGKIVLKNAYDQQEFITSNDMNFRPVNTYTGPDGSLYIVDMYRGIIQESNWTKEGSYLRPVIVEHGLDKNIGRGRIYRLVKKDHQQTPKPQLLDTPTNQLLQYLSHPNGWWRDNAQKLIILREDKSIVPQLEELVLGKSSIADKLMFWKDPASHLGRIHALWTLEGLGALDKSVILSVMDDEDPQLQKVALELGEPYLQNNDTEVLAKFKKLANTSNINVRKQVILSLQYAQPKGGNDLLNDLKAKENNENLLAFANRKLLGSNSDPWKDLRAKLVDKHPYYRDMVINGAKNFSQLCATCHGKNGKGVPVEDGGYLAPPLSGSAFVNGDQEKLINILLHGLTGPINGKEYSDVMPSLKGQTNEYIASVLSYIRTNLDNKAGIINPQTVQKVREKTKDRQKYWTEEELKNYK